MCVRKVILAVLSFMAFAASGATPYKKSLTQKKDAYVIDGVFTGGTAGPGASILGVRRTHSKKAKLERVIVELGDTEAKAGDGHMPYFQASVDKSSKQIVLDLAHLRFSKVSESSLKTLFRNSPFVASVSLTLDPEDKAGTMVLYLKKPARLEVFQLLSKKKPARVVLDLKGY